MNLTVAEQIINEYFVDPFIRSAMQFIEICVSASLSPNSSSLLASIELQTPSVAVASQSHFITSFWPPFVGCFSKATNFT